MRRTVHYIGAIVLCLVCVAALSAQTVERLGRGLVAYRSDDNGTAKVNISWRYLSTDAPGVEYNIYKKMVYTSGAEGPAQLITAQALAGLSWFSYEEKLKTAFRYELRKVVDGVETESPEAEYLLKSVADGGGYPYIEIPMKQVDGDVDWRYVPGDASVADLDGDGEMEIIIHRTGASQDNANAGITDAPVLQAYKLDGTFMWEINLGVNIREGAHYTQFMAYDLDGDGKAELVCKTAEGSKDSQGTNVGEAYFPEYKAKYKLTTDYNANAVYRNGSGYILQGPEFLTVFDGETGKEIVTTEYDPPRYSSNYNGGNEIPKLNPTTAEIKDLWGDNYGNRVDRFLACTAYLGGEHHSVVMCRGYYTRSVLVAYDYVDKKLVRRWKFDTRSSSSLSGYTGQGNHNLRVADVDGDGFDEIVYGQMTVDHDGTGLYTTGLNHGDALHIGDFIPERPGLEVLGVHEDKVNGTTLRDAATGEVIYQIPSGDDVGRGMGADIDPNHRGMEFWSARSDIRSSATSDVVGSRSGVSMNMACWWDGDLLRELQDGISITKYNYNTGKAETLLTATGCASNNSTKSNPCIQADILGDWREEVVWRTDDNKYIRIYLTPYPTDYRFHTFLEDNVYRMSVAYQNVAYNQPTNTGFYFGADLENIFPEKEVLVEGDSYVVDPVFDALSYHWSTGETSKTIELKRSDYQEGVPVSLTLDLNFRGYWFSDALSVTFAPSSSLDNLPAGKDVCLLSNHVVSSLSFGVKDAGMYQVSLWDPAGALCYSEEVVLNQESEWQSDISSLSAGIYLLRISGGKQAYYTKIVKSLR